MRPEMPFLAAGAITIAGGFAREKGWPKEGAGALIGTMVLVIVASATSGGVLAPLVRAFGLMLVLVAVLASVSSFPIFDKGK